MKILLLTDIHGNLPALEAVLNTPQARSADRVVSAGDHTGFGPCPRQVTERLRSLGAEILAGNHEERLPQADAPEFAGYNWSLLRWTRSSWPGFPWHGPAPFAWITCSLPTAPRRIPTCCYTPRISRRCWPGCPKESLGISAGIITTPGMCPREDGAG